VALDPGAFVFNAGDARVTDITDEFLAGRGLPPAAK
jgi:hypothetical protein